MNQQELKIRNQAGIVTIEDLKSSRIFCDQVDTSGTLFTQPSYTAKYSDGISEVRQEIYLKEGDMVYRDEEGNYRPLFMPDDVEEFSADEDELILLAQNFKAAVFSHSVNDFLRKSDTFQNFEILNVRNFHHCERSNALKRRRGILVCYNSGHLPFLVNMHMELQNKHKENLTDRIMKSADDVKVVYRIIANNRINWYFNTEGRSSALETHLKELYHVK